MTVLIIAFQEGKGKGRAETRFVAIDLGVYSYFMNFIFRSQEYFSTEPCIEVVYLRPALSTS